MNCPTCARRCKDHNQLACTVCHKHRNECDFGTCRRRPTVAVENRDETGEVVEVRRMCAKHAKFSGSIRPL